MAEVQLKLGVIFDQAVLRAQIAQATRIVNSEFTGRLNVKFNRQTLDKELNNLQRAIKRRVYRVEIGGNIDALPLKIKNLREQLKDLDGLKVNLGVTAQASLTKKEARKIRTTIRQQVIAEGGKIALPVTLSPISQTAANKFKADVLRKIGTLTIKAKVGAESGFAAGTSGAAGLMEYMRTQGLVGKTASGMTMQMRNDGNDIKQQLNDAVKSAQKIKSIFDGVAGSLATTGKSVANVQGKRLGLTNVPLMAGAVERRVERSAESIAGTTSAALLQRLYPEINATVTSLSTLRGQILRNSSKLSDFSLIIGLAAFAGFPFAKSIVKLTDSANNFAKLLDRLGLRLESATTKAAMAILNAASSRLLGGGSVAGLLPAAYRGIGAAAGPAGLLPPAYRGIGTTQTAGALPPAYRGLPFGFSFEALPSGAGGAEAGGALVALESGFIPQMRERFARHAKRFLFGIETQVVDLFDATRQAVNSAVDRYIASVQSRLSARARSAVRVQDLGAVQQPLLTGARIAGALPAAAVGRTPSRYAGGGETREQMFARRTAEAYARSALRGLSVMSARQPALPGTTFMGDDFLRGGGADRVRGVGRSERGGALAFVSTPLDRDYYRNARKRDEALKIAEASAKNFSTANTPLIGGLRGLAGEFAEATKQVLLYGTAYKGLAFITSLPGQILNAAKSQQQYNNALRVATQASGTYAKELLFVDNVQRAFGLDLETTRTGFVRLYASMSPAGFDSGSIERLFTGISAATAALQLTPDRADRVIYAFGQMASKGQVMSEELKGQLGDVLPGALAIFASAAGKSVKEFNAALEKGAYAGAAFRELMTKVTDELLNRFGTGAQAAGRSLQGLINTVRGDFTRTLEAFAPLANSAAQAVLVPLGNMLNRLSVSAKIVSGEMERLKGQIGKQEQVVLELKATNASQKDIDAARQSLEALKAEYDGLNEAFKDPAVQQQVKDLEALVEQLSKAGNFVKNFAFGIGNVLSPILTVLGGNFTTVIGTIASFAIGLATTRLALMGLTAALLAVKGVLTVIGFLRAAVQLGSLKAAMVQAGISSKALAAIFTFLGIQANAASIKVIGLRVALTALLVSTGIGALIALIGGLASAFATMGNRAQEAAEKAKQSIQSIQEARARGDVTTIEMQMATAKEDVREIDEAVKLARKERGVTRTRNVPGGGAVTEELIDTRNLSRGTKQAFKNVGIDLQQTTMTRDEYERALIAAAAAAKTAPQRTLTEGAAALPSAKRRKERIGMNMPNMPPTEDTAQGADEKAARDAERAAEHARRLADDKRKYEADLMKLNAAQAIALDDAAFDHWKSLQSLKYDLLETGQNEWMARETKFQRDLQAIEIRRIEAIRQARLETVKAESEAQASAYTAGDIVARTGGAVSQDPLTRGRSTGPHLHAQGAGMTEERLAYLVDKYLVVGGKAASSYGRSRGARGHGYNAIDFLTPQNTPIQLAAGASIAPFGAPGGRGGLMGKVTTPEGSFELGHLTQLQQPQAGVPPARQRAEAKKDYASALASQTAINAKEREQYIAKQANIRAQQEINLLVKEYVASIAPVEQQKLENSILQERIRLLGSGLYDEALDTQQKIAETEMRRALGVKASTQAIQDNQAAIDKNNQAVKAGTKTQEQASAENASYAQGIATNTQKINELNQATKDYIPTLQEKLRLTQQAAEAELQGAIQRATPLGGMGLSAGFIGDAATKYEEAIGRGASQERAREFAELQNQLTLLETRNNAIKSSVLAIGDAFGTAMTSGVASLVDGTASAEEVFSDFLKGVGQALLQAAQQMIATYIAIGIARIFAGLGGSTGGGEKGLNLTDMKKYSFEGPIGGMFADGGIATGGFQAFANGGVVNGPTLGLVGEGRYNEAIVPLPDGRSIPVIMKGSEQSSRELLSAQSASMASPVLSMSFETTTINGVEYVSRDQLETAMMETRRLAARDGANRGAALAIDRLQHSPNTRRRIGMR